MDKMNVENQNHSQRRWGTLGFLLKIFTIAMYNRITVERHGNVVLRFVAQRNEIRSYYFLFFLVSVHSYSEQSWTGRHFLNEETFKRWWVEE